MQGGSVVRGDQPCALGVRSQGPVLRRRKGMGTSPLLRVRLGVPYVVKQRTRSSCTSTAATKVREWAGGEETVLRRRWRGEPPSAQEEAQKQKRQGQQQQQQQQVQVQEPEHEHAHEHEQGQQGWDEEQEHGPLKQALNGDLSSVSAAAGRAPDGDPTHQIRPATAHAEEAQGAVVPCAGAAAPREEVVDDDVKVALRCAASVSCDGVSWFRPARRRGSPESGDRVISANDCIPGVATWRSRCLCAADMCWPFPSPIPFQKCSSDACTAVICLACCGDAEACDACGSITPYQELVCAPCLARQRRAGKAWVGPPCSCGNRVCRNCTACACPPSPVPLGPSSGRSFAEGAASAAESITPGVASSWDLSSGGGQTESGKRRPLVSPHSLAMLLTTSPPPPSLR